jgi:hypothetical protein
VSPASRQGGKPSLLNNSATRWHPDWAPGLLAGGGGALATWCPLSLVAVMLTCLQAPWCTWLRCWRKSFSLAQSWPPARKGPWQPGSTRPSWTLNPPPPPKIEARLSLQWGRVWRMLWALGCPPHGFIYFSIPLPHPYLPIIQQNHFLPIFVGCNFFGVKFCTGIFLLFEISVILLRTIKVFFIVRFQVQKKNMSTECIVLDW